MTDRPMRHLMLKSKIHRARVTGADLHYEGSIAIDEALMEAADVLNLSNGSRTETSLIRGRRNSGDIILNGALARLARVVGLVIVLSYTWMARPSARVKLSPGHRSGG